MLNLEPIKEKVNRLTDGSIFYTTAGDIKVLVAEVERLRHGVRSIVGDNMLTVPEAQTQLLALLGKE